MTNGTKSETEAATIWTMPDEGPATGAKDVVETLVNGNGARPMPLIAKGDAETAPIPRKLGGT